MIQGRWFQNRVIRHILTLMLYSLCQTAMAVSFLPGSVEPGRVTENYLPSQPNIPTAVSKISRPEEKPTGLGPEAEKIKFKLNKIDLEGNHVYTTQQLSTLYQDKLNKVISIAELQEIVQSITNYYRNAGYILTRAILPPQHVKNGVVQIRIIEGYIDNVQLIGNPRGADRIVLDYGNQISLSRPLQLKDMEYYLLLANQLPGVQAKAILEPSKTETGASDLSLSVDTQRFNSMLSYDNYGTLYIGPHQVTAESNVNSVLRSGDMTRATYLAATREAELHYLDIYYQTPIGVRGLTLSGGGNQSLTAPGFVLEPLSTRGKANTYYISLSYPAILSRSKYLIFDAGFTYLDSRVTQLDVVQLYNDHIRPVKIGGVYSFADRFNGSNIFALHLEQGLNIWGANDNPDSLTTSRFGADGIFTKWTTQLAHTQPLFSSRFSLYGLLQGEYSNKPLLASEQFGFGGSLVGRGYDPAEILGDRGAAGSFEFRMDTFPQKWLLQSVQYYIFYDIGKIWNIEELPDIPQNQSAASTGFGARFSWSRFITGNVMFTQVATKPIASEDLIGRGKNPKIFFSVTASV